MTIHLYARFEGMSAEDLERQEDTSLAALGTNGRLREEDDHERPYATERLVYEAWNRDSYEGQEPYRGAPIPAANMEGRLPEAILVALLNEAAVRESEEAAEDLRGLGVRLPPGEDPIERARWARERYRESREYHPSGPPTASLPGRDPTVGAIGNLNDRDTRRELASRYPSVGSLVSFVSFCRACEQETGKPVRVAMER